MGSLHRRLWEAGGSRLALTLAVGIGLAGAALVIAQATLLAGIVSRAFLGHVGLGGLSGPLLALAAVISLRAAGAWAGEFSRRLCAGRATSRIRERLLTRVLETAPSHPGGERTGELAHTLGSGVDTLEDYYARYLPQLALACLVPPLIIVWVAHVDLLSGLILVVTAPLLPIFLWLVGVGADRRARRRWQVLSLLNAHFLDVVEGLPTLKLFGRAKVQREAIGRVCDRYRTATMDTLRLAFLSSLVLELAASLNIALVAVAIGLRLVQGSLGLEAGLIVLLLVPEVYLPIRQAGAEFHASADATASARRVFQVLDASGPRRVRPRASMPDPRSAVIRLESICFRYPDRPGLVLDGLDLEVRPGERLGIVGPSGAGKSTLLSLLLCFLRPSSGRILLGATDLADVDPDAWRAQVAWVPQRPHLFTGSIADNLRLGGRDAGEAELWRWLELVGAAAWVEALPAGLSSPVGERGQLLSSGQRQSLALARALARGSPVLLLDEPTANLDAFSARAVAEALAGLPGRTCLLAGHDPSLERCVDRVVRLEGRRLWASNGGRGEPLEAAEAAEAAAGG